MLGKRLNLNITPFLSQRRGPGAPRAVCGGRNFRVNNRKKSDRSVVAGIQSEERNLRVVCTKTKDDDRTAMASRIMRTKLMMMVVVVDVLALAAMRWCLDYRRSDKETLLL